VLQIVLARAAHADEAMRFGHAGLAGGPRANAGRTALCRVYMALFSKNNVGTQQVLPPDC
ncbi:MAG: hypothetical protein ACXWK1_03540, partial [Caulobacteraceae bacterium]